MQRESQIDDTAYTEALKKQAYCLQELHSSGEWQRTNQSRIMKPIKLKIRVE